MGTLIFLLTVFIVTFSISMIYYSNNLRSKKEIVLASIVWGIVMVIFFSFWELIMNFERFTYIKL